MKKVVCSILALALCLAFFACAAQQPAAAPAQAEAPAQVEAPAEEAKEPIKITWVNPLVGHPVYNVQDQGCMDAAADYGVELSIVGPSELSADNMIQCIESAIIDKQDGVITCPYTPEAFVPVFEQIKEAGIAAVFTNTDIDGRADLRVQYNGTMAKEYGIAAAENMEKLTGGSAKICIMQSALDSTLQNEQNAAFTEKIKEYPGMEVVVTEADSADKAIALDKFEQIFTAYPEVNAVFMLEGTGADAAAQIAKEKGREMTILAIDDIEETLQGIRDGKIAGTMTQNFYRQGYEAVRAIVEHINGGTDVPAVRDTGTVLVTKDNVDSYQDDMANAVAKFGEAW